MFSACFERAEKYMAWNLPTQSFECKVYYINIHNYTEKNGDGFTLQLFVKCMSANFKQKASNIEMNVKFRK